MRTSPPERRNGGPLFAFEFARAAAALVVLLSHARDLILLDADGQPPLSWLGRAVYALSGLGHQAVIVFFVISGFLVTRSMVRSSGEDRWSLSAFALARLTRLWVVLVPCLLIGMIFDHIGISVGGRADAATYGNLAITSQPASPPALDALTVFGNLFFLQTIAVKPLGSNGALWSLANEAWYYVLAALAYNAWHLHQATPRAVGSVAAAALILALLPAPIVTLAPVWAFGAALAMLDPKRKLRLAETVLSGAAVLATLALSRLRVGHPMVLDLLLGLSTAWLLRCSLHWKAGAGRRSQAVRVLSRISYSLYLSHLPLLALATTLFLGGHRQPFSVIGLGWVLAAVGLGLAFASLVWWCFERQTALVRTLVSATFMLMWRRGLGAGPAIEEAAP